MWRLLHTYFRRRCSGWGAGTILGVLLTTVILGSGDGQAPTVLATAKLWAVVNPIACYRLSRKSVRQWRLFRCTATQLASAVLRACYVLAGSRLITRHFVSPINKVTGYPLTSLTLVNTDFRR